MEVAKEPMELKNSSSSAFATMKLVDSHIFKNFHFVFYDFFFYFISFRGLSTILQIHSFKFLVFSHNTSHIVSLTNPISLWLKLSFVAILHASIFSHFWFHHLHILNFQFVYIFINAQKWQSTNCTPTPSNTIPPNFNLLKTRNNNDLIWGIQKKQANFAKIKVPIRVNDHKYDIRFSQSTNLAN
jgi:hypothetical protein